MVVVLIGLMIVFLLFLILCAILWPKALRTIAFLGFVAVVLFVFAAMDQAPAQTGAMPAASASAGVI